MGYATLVLAALLQVAIVRLLGKENFGIYSTALAMVALVEVPLVVRGGEIALRMLGKAAREGDAEMLKCLARKIVRYDLLLYVFTFLLLSLVAWVAHRFLEFNPLLFVILALKIPAQAGFGVYKGYFTIFDKVTEMGRYEFVCVVALACLNLAGVLLGGIYGLAVSMVMAMVMETYLAFLFTKSYLPAVEQGVTSPSSRMQTTFTREGIFPVVRNLFFNGFNQIDILLLGVFQKPEIVAVYKVGKSLASLPIKIAFPVWRYLQPKLMEAIQTGDTRKEKRVILAGAGILGAVMFCFLPLVLFGGESAIVFLYGEDFADAFKHFLILLIGIWAFHGVAGWFKFWVVVTHSRLHGIGVYAAAFFLTILLGAIFGSVSPVAMSYVVATVLLAMSFAAFVMVFRK